MSQAFLVAPVSFHGRLKKEKEEGKKRGGAKKRGGEVQEREERGDRKKKKKKERRTNKNSKTNKGRMRASQHTDTRTCTRASTCTYTHSHTHWLVHLDLFLLFLKQCLPPSSTQLFAHHHHRQQSIPKWKVWSPSKKRKGNHDLILFHFHPAQNQNWRKEQDRRWKWNGRVALLGFESIASCWNQGG